jgi:hypothetical protein
MPIRLNPSRLRAKLGIFHRSRVARIIKSHSPLNRDLIPGEFNVSGFQRDILDLSDTPSSFWGVDRCLRIREKIDANHSLVFHMGIFACAVDLGGDFRDPWSDTRFHALQLKVLDQFFALFGFLGIRRKRLEASYFAGMRLTSPRYDFPPDRISKTFLNRRGIRSVPVASIANLHVGREGGLAGPRVEVACDGLEIGNVLFGCLRLRKGKLQPVNYVAMYAVGLERLLSIINRGDLLTSIERHVRCRRLIARKVRPAGSPLFEREVLSLMFGAEALAAIPDQISTRQRRLVRRMGMEMKPSMLHLGLSGRDVGELVAFYRRWRD